MLNPVGVVSVTVFEQVAQLTRGHFVKIAMTHGLMYVNGGRLFNLMWGQAGATLDFA
jgi:hypothetical protein